MERKKTDLPSSLVGLIQLELDTLRELVNNDGPSVEEYPILTAVLDHLSGAINDEHEHVYTDFIPCVMKEVFSTGSLMGFAFKQPSGHPGDFEILERTYDHFVSGQSEFKRWDAYWHQTPLAKALRNRKDYFKSLIFKAEQINPRAKILSLGSGPARAVHEYLKGQPESHLRFVLVDPNELAHAYARDRLADLADKVEFVNCSPFNFAPSDQFDLIWSAHGFDYYDDENYSGLLTDLQGMLTQGGQIVIGNFSQSDSNTAFMRFLGWHVYHRKHAEIMNLASKSGAKKRDIHVSNRAEDVNLFLHIGRDAHKV